MAYLLDSNICIFLMKGVPEVAHRAKGHSRKDLFVSEVSVAELKYGVAKSQRPLGNREHLSEFLNGISVIPISEVLDVFGFEKARLTRIGEVIPDFDLLIGATAIHHDLTLVTNNTKHFQRLNDIKLEDWTK
ncbi:MAG: PIN domain-containing protein [Flavobacteriales bacterium]|nr:PIN domain-containing protein [Flavobacteriales bacterium]